MPVSNGGTPAPLNLLLIPWTTVLGVGQMSTFDPTNFNDPVEGSFYNWKVEDILAGRTPTCNCVIVTYRDLGPAQIAVTLSGTDDAGELVSSTTGLVTIGTVAATGAIVTAPRGLISLSLTAQNLQLSITRAPNAGPVSIVKVRLEGEVEKTAYA